MGYHLRKIKKGKLGTASKIQEELEEYEDALEQNCKIMAQLELADIYGALAACAASHGLSMQDLDIMNKITEKAFKAGKRK